MDDNAMVRELGSRIGYGNMMHRAQEEWRKLLKNWSGGDISGGEFIVGPCVSMTTSCLCRDHGERGGCDYCCGTGWVTKAVKKLLIERSLR